MPKTQLKITGARPGNPDQQSGVAIVWEDQPPGTNRDFIAKMRAGLVALYRHELQKLGVLQAGNALDAEARLFEMELRIEENFKE